MILNVAFLLIGLASFVAAGIIGSDDRPQLFVRILVSLLIGEISLSVLFARCIPMQHRLDTQPGKVLIRWICGFSCLFILAMSYSLRSFDRDHIVGLDLDSVSYFVQANIFASGHTSVPSHALGEFFKTGYCINDGRFYSKYFPGWPLLLSLGVKIGVPWLINPILAFASVFIVYRIGRSLYDAKIGIFAALLLLVSQNLYLVSTSYLSEAAALFFCALFFLCVVALMKKPGMAMALSAGACLGFVFIIRPFSCVAVGAPVLLYALVIFIREKRGVVRLLGGLALGFLPLAAVLLAYNYTQTGNPFLNPFEYYNPYDKLGFGLRSADIMLAPQPFTIIAAFKNLGQNLLNLNWTGVPFLFVFLIFWFAGKKNRWDYLLFSVVGSVIACQFFYHAKSTRYYIPAFFALFLLTARGLSSSEGFFERLTGKRIRNLGAFLFLLSVLASGITFMTPQRVLARMALYRQLSNPFLLAKDHRLHNSIVFMKSVPERYNNISYYIQNPLNYESPVLYLWDRGARNRVIMDRYAGRDFYVYEFNRKTGSGKLTKTK
jgi:hypothetical protein